jgi:hypothetical protein
VILNGFTCRKKSEGSGHRAQFVAGSCYQLRHI